MIYKLSFICIIRTPSSLLRIHNWLERDPKISAMRFKEKEIIVLLVIKLKIATIIFMSTINKVERHDISLM